MEKTSLEPSLSTDNKSTYDKPENVEYYDDLYGLNAAEIYILDVSKKLQERNHMLDIGVGGGRTTMEFSSVFDSYTGIDYSPPMIDICRKKFSGQELAFHVCDATDMHIFNDSEFDFILFSFNGIDGVDINKRADLLKEVHRVGKTGALFAFSSHNLRYFPKLLKFRKCRHPLYLLKEFKRYWKIHKINPPFDSFKDEPFAILNDGAHDFGLSLCYYKPEFQVNELLKSGYSNIKVISLDTGEKIESSKYTTSYDPWLYYLGEIVK